MSKDTTDNIYNLLMGIKQDVGSIKTTVDSHDKNIVDIKNSVTRMESKQNEDMVKFIAEKEAIYARLTPLEKDLKSRQEIVIDVKKKVWDIVWDWAKLGIVFLAGYLLTIISKIK